MEFSLSVVDITSDFPNVIKLSGDVEATVELPLEKLGVALKKGDKIDLA